MPTKPLFSVEDVRHLRHRHAAIRRVERPTVVLGSTQRADVVHMDAARANGVDVARRRSGGGAVLLRPSDQVWADAWVPRDDPLWVNDLTSSAAWAGAWWSDALATLGVGDCEVHRGPADPGDYGALVCFAGRGPGEVIAGGRKIVGLSQWRSREGALFMMCAYARWDPAPLVALLETGDSARTALETGLAGVAVGVADLLGSPVDLDDLAGALLASFPGWEPPEGAASD